MRRGIACRPPVSSSPAGGDPTDRSNLTNAGVQELSTLERPLEAPLEWPGERLVKPCKRRLRLRDLLREMPVVRVLASRDLKVKYKQSLLGPLWLFFQPLALLAGFLVAFQHFAGVKISGQPYAVFVLVGLSVWSYFQAALTIGTASLVTNMNLVRYTACPRLSTHGERMAARPGIAAYRASPKRFPVQLLPA